MDLYFQGLAWFNKGIAPDNLAKAQSYYDRALADDPDNVDALVESARVDVNAGASLFVADPLAALAAAEIKVARALSLVPDHPRGHLVLGFLYIFTKRAVLGIAECDHGLALDRNLAGAHSLIGLGKTFAGRAEETDAHVAEALRLSPKDSLAYLWMTHAGIAMHYLGNYVQAVAWYRRAIEANRNSPLAHFWLAAALIRLERPDEARTVARFGLALNPHFTVSRALAHWTAFSDDPTHKAQIELMLEGLRAAGAPEG
jgi:tetratricopeptide (TPR) repeat protein